MTEEAVVDRPDYSIGCPRCSSIRVMYTWDMRAANRLEYACNDCGHKWARELDSD